jgi:hypothetical protein
LDYQTVVSSQENMALEELKTEKFWVDLGYLTGLSVSLSWSKVWPEMGM